MRTFSPGRAQATGFSFAHTPSILNCWRVGMMMTFWPCLTVPLSTLPMAMVPLSVYLSSKGMRTAAEASRPLITRLSKSCSRVGLSVLFSLAAQLFFHHGQAAGSTSSLTFAPESPEMGMNLTSFLIMYPQDFKKGRSFVTHSSNLSFDQLTVGSSILLITTTMCDIPKVLQSIACSRLCPPFSNPASNSPFLAEITKTPTSA
mmetsp:Transcript_8833/g.16030  ORF Transcript_8833/g.16030 Transcript_8833/m.16030 type:complete len:203 (-) Transcript_8833:1039-1647(-)